MTPEPDYPIPVEKLDTMIDRVIRAQRRKAWEDQLKGPRKTIEEMSK